MSAESIFKWMADSPGEGSLYTVGHSNQPLEHFLGLLEAHGIRILADIRRFPGSRRWPWFGKDQLEGSLAAKGIAYRHVPGLGGRRSPMPDSPNGAWRVPQFRAFADYMDTPEFKDSLSGLLALLPEGPVAAMCSEALPWRCHRNLVSDAVLARGVPVFHIFGNGSLRRHAFPDFAKVDRDADPPRVTYPPAEEPQARLSL